ncbi:MAG: hypothetical protein ABW321_01535 [Polyangiales bacterium]
MPRLQLSQVWLGSCYGVDDQNFVRMCELISSGTIPTRRGGHALPDIDWLGVIHKLREKLRHPYTFGEELDIQDVLREWSELIGWLADIVAAAKTNVESCIASVTNQREQSFAVTGRMLWGTMTIAVPPPVGTILGAIIYAAIEKESTLALQRLIEWSLQTPLSYGPGGKLTPQRRPYNWPKNHAPGGQVNIRDLKDVNQMMKSLEKLFGSDRTQWIRELNQKVPRNVMRIPQMRQEVSFDLHGRAVRTNWHADDMKGVVKDICTRGQTALRAGVVDVFKTLVQDTQKLRLIAEASRYVQGDILLNTGEASPKGIVREGCDLFLNRMAHTYVEGIRGARADTYVVMPNRSGGDLKERLQRRFERELFARYFLNNKEDHGPTAQTFMTARKVLGMGFNPALETWADNLGTIPSSFFASGYLGQLANPLIGAPLEERLVSLGILYRANSMAPIRVWRPNHAGALPDHGQDNYQAVPYTSVDRAARGRLFAWARAYLEGPRQPEVEYMLFHNRSAANFPDLAV